MVAIICAVIVKDFITPKVRGEVRHVVCPGIDMCNHRDEGNAMVEFEYFNDCYR